MVRTIDGEARRRVLADAVWRLLRAGGLEAASVRAVAAEAGLSAGSVRHFFTTQDELHVFAMGELVRRTTERVERALASAPDGEPPGGDDAAGTPGARGPADATDASGATEATGAPGAADATGATDAPDRARRRVLAGLTALLPTTPETEAEFLTHLQFTARATVHPALAPEAARSLRAMEDFYLRCLAYLVRSGAAHDDLDVPEETRRLAVLMDGLVVRRLTAPDLLSAEQMLGLLQAHLTSLGGGGARP